MFSKSVHTYVGRVVEKHSLEGYIHEKMSPLLCPSHWQLCEHPQLYTRCRIWFRFVANKNTKPRRRTCLYGYPDAIVSVQRRNRATCKHFSGFNLIKWPVNLFFFLIYLSLLFMTFNGSIKRTISVLFSLSFQTLQYQVERKDTQPLISKFWH